MVSEVLRELDQNDELTQSLQQDSRMLQINMGQSKGYQVLVEANATAYIGDQYHLDTEIFIKAFGELLDEFAKKQPIVGTPNNLPRSGAIAFIGRDSKLREIDQQLQSNARIAITAVKGMGGIGKTELVLQYAIATLPKSVYPGGICWLRSRGQEIATQIVSFARANLGLTIPDDMEAAEQVVFTWQRWREGNTLIVIDDVNDYDEIAPYLPPPDPRFKVLITTRQSFGASVTTIDIKELSDDDAIALLKSIVEEARIESQRSEAEALCTWVGNLPLGLELLGRFLARKPDWAIAKLLERLESQRLAAKALIEPESGMTATLGVAAALELSWAELSKSEQDLACLLGMFAVAPIPWTLVEQHYEGVVSDELEKWRDEGLRDRSLLNRVGEETYQLHQIMQEFFREKLSQKKSISNQVYEQKLKDCLHIFSNNWRFQYSNDDSWIKCNLYLPHVISLLDFAKVINLQIRNAHEAYVTLFLKKEVARMLIYTRSSGQSDGESYLREAIIEIESILGENIVSINKTDSDLLNLLCESYWLISLLLRQKGKTKEAICFNKKRVSKFNILFSGDNADYQNARKCLACNYVENGEIDTGEKIIRDVINYFQNNPNSKTESTSLGEGLGESYFLLGRILYKRNVLEESLKYFLKAEKIIRSDDRYDESHFELGLLSYFISVCYADLEYSREKEKYREISKAILKKKKIIKYSCAIDVKKLQEEFGNEVVQVRTM